MSYLPATLQTINRLKRELANLIVVITPWEMRIKKIESNVRFTDLIQYVLYIDNQANKSKRQLKHLHAN